MTNQLTLFRLSNIVDAFFDDMALTPFAKESFTPNYPKTNIYWNEGTSSVVIESAVPGFTKDDISVRIVGNILTITGMKSANPQPSLPGIDAPSCDNTYFSRELAQRNFENEYTLSSRLDYEKTKVSVKDGLLHVIIPMKESEKPKTIELKVE